MRNDRIYIIEDGRIISDASDSDGIPYVIGDWAYVEPSDAVEREIEAEEGPTYRVRFDASEGRGRSVERELERMTGCREIFRVTAEEWAEIAAALQPEGMRYEEARDLAAQAWDDIARGYLDGHADAFDLDGMRAAYLDATMREAANGWIFRDLDADDLNALAQRFDRGDA